MLSKVFASQPKGYIFVAWKDGDVFHDRAFKTLREAEAFLASKEKTDIYFSPTTYARPARRKENVLPSCWLWQDLDAVDPRTLSLRPTVAWESSPHRYQALWKLDRQYPPSEIEVINKHLAAATHADHGSWILTKVLRVPGSINLKYPEHPHGRLLWFDKNHYTKQAIMGRSPPQEVQDMLSAPVEQGKRSDVLWKAEHELAKAGFSIDEIYHIIKDSQWNKYKGRNDEQERLMHEIALAMKSRPLQPVSKLKVIKHAELMGNQSLSPGWLIDKCWTRGAHGIIAGEPKSFKSTIAMDMAVSIASGKPFMGEFKVRQQGPVLIVQNENADWIVKERMGAISCHHGIGGNVKKTDGCYRIHFPLNLPIYYVNNQGFSMSSQTHRDEVEKLIQEVKPVLVIFDPLYLMFDGDVNSAKDLNPALSWMLWLKNTYNLSLVIVHHWRKAQGTTKRGGQRMLGSTTLHGWVESAWYVSSGEEVVIEREFRAAQSPPKLKLRIIMGDNYDVEILGNEEDSDDVVLDYVSLHPGCNMRAVMEELGLTRRRAKRLLTQLVGSKDIRIVDEHYFPSGSKIDKEDEK